MNPASRLDREPVRSQKRAQGPSLWISVVGVALGLTAWCLFMLPEWWRNADLSHGLVTPLLFGIAVHEARTRGVRRFLPPRPLYQAVFGALLTFALLVLVLAGLVAAALAWSNALVAFLIASSLSAILVAGLIAVSQLPQPWLPLNWPALVGCLLWLLSAPIPPGTYSRLSVSLQAGITRAVINTLHILGVPAQQVGNIIQLSTVRVGVEEACSGIRSLVSCVVAALFISATLMKRPWARTALILIAAPLAIGMNYLRSLALTMLAAQGRVISGLLHDISGYAVLVTTALMLAALAKALDRPGAKTPQTLEALSARSAAPIRTYSVSVIAALALAAGFAIATRPAPLHAAVDPKLDHVLPAHFPTWRVETSADLYRFSATLKTKHLAQRTYLKETFSGPLQITVYIAYWKPGQAPVSLVSSHTPDACWPGAGWVALPGHSSQVTISNRTTLAHAEYRCFAQGELAQHVWFWHLYRGEPVTDVNPFSPLHMVRVVLRYGIRSQGEQVFLRISSNRPWQSFENEPLIEELFRGFQSLGL